MQTISSFDGRSSACIAPASADNAGVGSTPSACARGFRVESSVRADGKAQFRIVTAASDSTSAAREGDTDGSAKLGSGQYVFEGLSSFGKSKTTGSSAGVYAGWCTETAATTKSPARTVDYGASASGPSHLSKRSRISRQAAAGTSSSLSLLSPLPLPSSPAPEEPKNYSYMVRCLNTGRVSEYVCAIPHVYFAAAPVKLRRASLLSLSRLIMADVCPLGRWGVHYVASHNVILLVFKSGTDNFFVLHIGAFLSITWRIL